MGANWVSFKRLLATERARAVGAFAVWCFTLWLGAVIPTHPITEAIIPLLPIAATALLFWPEIARLRITYNQKTRNESPAWLYIFALASVLAVTISGVNLYHNLQNQPRTLSLDECAESYISGKHFRIADLADGNNTIEGRTIENCWLYGPAVIMMMDEVSLVHSTFEEATAHQFIVASEGSAGAGTGVIILRDCKINHCRLYNISVVGNAQNVSAWKANNTGAGTDHPNVHAEGAP
jgi:hypothetical protein